MSRGREAEHQQEPGTGAGVAPANCPEGNCPQDRYQTAQLRHSMIKWVPSTADCLKIINEAHPVVLR